MIDQLEILFSVVPASDFIKYATFLMVMIFISNILETFEL